MERPGDPKPTSADGRVGSHQGRLLDTAGRRIIHAASMVSLDDGEHRCASPLVSGGTTVLGEASTGLGEIGHVGLSTTATRKLKIASSIVRCVRFGHRRGWTVALASTGLVLAAAEASWFVLAQMKLLGMPACAVVSVCLCHSVIVLLDSVYDAAGVQMEDRGIVFAGRCSAVCSMVQQLGSAPAIPARAVAPLRPLD